MAIRNIRLDNDELLRKVSKEIEVIDNKTRELALDMLDTMYKNDGVGLAAPQVGILKRIITYDVGTGPKVIVNPVIIKKSGSQTCEEGCLSSPYVFGTVDRPKEITVQGFDLEGEKIKIKAKELEAIVICHETDHLDGKLFLDIARDIYKLSEEEITELAKDNSKDKDKKKNKNSKKNNKKKKEQENNIERNK